MATYTRAFAHIGRARRRAASARQRAQHTPLDRRPERALNAMQGQAAPRTPEEERVARAWYDAQERALADEARRRQEEEQCSAR